jgi:hypothetical protein
MSCPLVLAPEGAGYASSRQFLYYASTLEAFPVGNSAIGWGTPLSACEPRNVSSAAKSKPFMSGADGNRGQEPRSSAPNAARVRSLAVRAGGISSVASLRSRANGKQ